jgi:hypothetical protein
MHHECSLWVILSLAVVDHLDWFFFITKVCRICGYPRKEKDFQSSPLLCGTTVPVLLARACSMVCIWVELPLWIKGKVWTSLQNSINLQAQGINCIDQAASFLDWSERSLRPSSPVARDVVAQESRPLDGLERAEYYIWSFLVLGRRVWISGHVDAS